MPTMERRRRSPRIEPEDGGSRAVTKATVDYRVAYETALVYLQRALRSVPRRERELIEQDFGNEDAIRAASGGSP